MNFAVHQYHFDERLESSLIEDHRHFLSWPLVYFLEEDKNNEAYVGETTDILNRLKTHSKTASKRSLNTVNLILSELFNKSATLDLESNLIRYISADGKYRLQNGNLGISNHQFYQQKEVYWELFKDIWNELKQLFTDTGGSDRSSENFHNHLFKGLDFEQRVEPKLFL